MKLLVPTDFSKNARRAVDYAVKIADKSGADITLLHAHQIIDTESQSRKLLFEEYNFSIARKLHDELKIQRKRIGKINTAIKITAELSDNTTRRSIIDASSGCDLIVMGTQGASGFKRIFMGSVTAGVIGDAAVPVLAIPRSYKWRHPENILFATNLFEQGLEILDILFKLLKIFGASLHIVVFSDTDESNEAEQAQLKNKLDQYRQDIGQYKKDIKITAAHIKGNNFEDTLQQYIDVNKIDMLAMITQKRSFLEAIFNRSKTKKMAYRTNIPLLAIPFNYA